MRTKVQIKLLKGFLSLGMLAFSTGSLAAIGEPETRFGQQGTLTLSAQSLCPTASGLNQYALFQTKPFPSGDGVVLVAGVSDLPWWHHASQRRSVLASLSATGSGFVQHRCLDRSNERDFANSVGVDAAGKVYTLTPSRDASSNVQGLLLERFTASLQADASHAPQFIPFPYVSRSQSYGFTGRDLAIFAATNPPAVMAAGSMLYPEIGFALGIFRFGEPSVPFKAVDLVQRSPEFMSDVSGEPLLARFTRSGAIYSAWQRPFDALDAADDQLVIQRYLPSGEPDPQFADGSRYLVNHGTGIAKRQALLIDANDQVLLMFSHKAEQAANDQSLHIIKLHHDGRPDTRFGEQGKRTLTLPQTPYTVDNTDRKSVHHSVAATIQTLRNELVILVKRRADHEKRGNDGEWELIDATPLAPMIYVLDADGTQKHYAQLNDLVDTRSVLIYDLISTEKHVLFVGTCYTESAGHTCLKSRRWEPAAGADADSGQRSGGGGSTALASLLALLMLMASRFHKSSHRSNKV